MYLASMGMAWVTGSLAFVDWNGWRRWIAGLGIALFLCASSFSLHDQAMAWGGAGRLVKNCADRIVEAFDATQPGTKIVLMGTPYSSQEYGIPLLCFSSVAVRFWERSARQGDLVHVVYTEITDPRRCRVAWRRLDAGRLMGTVEHGGFVKPFPELNPDQAVMMPIEDPGMVEVEMKLPPDSIYFTLHDGDLKRMDNAALEAIGNATSVIEK